MQKGFSLLAAHRYKEGLEVGRKLAYLRLGQLAKAIAIVEKGVAKAGRSGCCGDCWAIVIPVMFYPRVGFV